MDNKDNKFPDCFPKNFESQILPKGIRFENIEVFRVIKSGRIDKEAFISTCEETFLGKRPPGYKDNPEDPGYYSTSCNLESDDLDYFLSICCKREPAAFIAKGITAKECGPCQLTCERDSHAKKTHVDWWIYKDSVPQKHFTKVGENNG